MRDTAAEVAGRGFAIVPKFLTPGECDTLVAALERLPRDSTLRRRAGETFGARRLIERIPAARELADNVRIRGLVTAILSEQAIPVRSLLFDKTPVANWRVPWHQDVTIAVTERRELPRYRAWSVKDGLTHVQPPIEVLRHIVSLRFHLDDCGEKNGPLLVVPGSHLLGRLSGARTAELRASIPFVTCVVPRGGLIVMSPLILHASSPATEPGHRRVIHLEFSDAKLPDNLNWAE